MKKITKIANGYVGYTEGPNNDTKFGKWFGLNYQPWCAMAVSKIFHEAGKIGAVAPKTKPKGFASCDEWLKHLSKNGQLVPIGEAKRGDLVFFQFDKDAEPDHVGIVRGNSKKLRLLNVWEGNTSSGRAGSQSNGDGFYVRRRSYSLVMAIARPTAKGAK